MNHLIAGRFRKCITTVTGSLGLFCLFAALAPAPQARAWDEKQGRAAQLAELGKKFDGAATCAECHAKSAPEAAPSPLMTENATWNTKDKHSTAAKVLKKPRPEDLAKRPALAEIGKNMKIAKVDKEPKCLACHAMNVPDALQGQNFSAREGVSCDSCHGPSGDWNGPHKNKGWTNEQRAAAAAAALKGAEEWPGQNAHKQLLKTGLYDTKPVVARAEICVSCHLAIDPAMVKAGHPQPFFELNKFTADEPQHWRERADEAGPGHVRTWAVGQVVCMRDAMLQLADRAKNGADPASLKDALEQALAHYSMVKLLVDAKAIDAGGAALDKGAALKAALADPAGKAKDIEAAATALAAEFKNLAGPATNMKPDSALAAKLLQAVAGDASLGKDLGQHGATQQSLAIWSLYNSTAAAKEGDDTNKKIGAVVESVGPYAPAYDAAKYGASITALQGALPK